MRKTFQWCSVNGMMRERRNCFPLYLCGFIRHASVGYPVRWLEESGVGNIRDGQNGFIWQLGKQTVTVDVMPAKTGEILNEVIACYFYRTFGEFVRTVDVDVRLSTHRIWREGLYLEGKEVLQWWMWDMVVANRQLRGYSTGFGM